VLGLGEDRLSIYLNDHLAGSTGVDLDELIGRSQRRKLERLRVRAAAEAFG
jgi:hypothetical protein